MVIGEDYPIGSDEEATSDADRVTACGKRENGHAGRDCSLRDLTCAELGAL